MSDATGLDVGDADATATGDRLAGEALLDLLNGFIGELRNAGLPVSLTENLDAMEAVRHIPLDDRNAFKYALAATLVKNHSHWRAFETVFEVYFSLRGTEYSIDEDADAGPELDLDDDQVGELPEGAGKGDGSGGHGDGMTPEELAEALYQALLKGDQAMMRAMARQAVKRYAGMEPGRPVGGTYYLYRTMRNLDLEGMLERLMEQSRQDAPEPLSSLEERLEHDEFETRIEQLKQEIEAEIRRRLVADRGVEAMAKTLRKPLPEDIDFMHASREEMISLRKALQPLTRRLAVRLARKRRHGRKGALDFRNTVRHSLSYGGVPAEPKFKYPRPAKPEIFVVADISGSVAAFARFTLHLVHAIASQFSRVRSFVFIDGIDEVTRFFEGEEDIVEAIHRVNTEADVVWVDGHSDYGHAFEVFWNRWGREIGPKTTVIILGDARNNYHASQSWVIKEMRQKARHVYWLNPEPKAYWDTGDSIVGEYGVHCDGTFECRNLRQLERFVDHLV
ncbi:vWA domain-containing protein [Dermatobacter hominis]|uniref:vWA domain-containing protein n=1 Tax=Dermatobacter hominis TaxID=2884263 RepID=UPI001D120FDD|nr:VWA domain-containing protein [Dermatobacter hominis]UDY35742.1 VWA domain-containing protein [Dermatobacter hominis]